MYAAYTKSVEEQSISLIFTRPVAWSCRRIIFLCPDRYFKYCFSCFIPSIILCFNFVHPRITSSYVFPNIYHLNNIYFLHFDQMQRLQISYKGMILEKSSLNLLENFKKGYCLACSYVQAVHGRISESEQFGEISKIMKVIIHSHVSQGLESPLSTNSSKVVSTWIKNSLQEDQSCTGKTLMVAPFNHELIEYYLSVSNLFQHKLFYYKEVCSVTLDKLLFLIMHISDH